VLDGRFRQGVDRRTGPFGQALARAGVSADLLTVTGLVMAAAAAWAIGSGRLVAGGLLMVAAGLPDLLDGPVAKASGRASKRGAFLDSVADRVSDALIFGGVAWYLQASGRPRLAMLALAVLAASSVVSYERAKAESLGFAARGGAMERAERLIALGAGLFVRPLLVPVLWVVLSLTLLTAAQRFASVWAQASRAASPGRADPGGWRRARVESRWRTWRQVAGRRQLGRSRRSGSLGGRWRARRQATVARRELSRRAVGGQTRSWRAVRSGRIRLGEALRRRVDGEG
jgi:CDP-diacylglycerol--glycerol-3-phosphate 3-phosphatidyltransferase